jgi:hypothetical protein
MGLALGLMCPIALLGLICIPIGVLLIFFAVKLQDTKEVISGILTFIGLLLIIAGLIGVGFYICLAFSIFSYPGY